VSSQEFIANPEETKELLPRYRLFYVGIGFAFCLILIRLWYLQILQGNELFEFSSKNHLKQNKIMAPRGLILDRDGKILVENLPGFEAILSPQYIESLDELATKIAPVLGTEPEKIIAKVQKSRRANGPFATIKIKDNLSRDEVFRLKRMRLDTPGLEIRESILRSYPLGPNGAQLFGYVGEISKEQKERYNQNYKGTMSFEQGDIIGKFGLEEILERDIRGKDGISFIQVDAKGRETSSQSPTIYGEKIRDQVPDTGNNVVLTLDKEIQEAAHHSFTAGNRIGGVVAMRTNGEVLAWINNPSFDPNEFSTVISPQTWSRLINDPFKPLRNKVIQDHNSPGSTFKPLVALAALEEKVVTPTTVINCPGALRFGGRPYHDHYKPGFGNITIFEALERSSNVFFYKMGIQLEVDKMYNYISLLGLGTRTGVEIPHEVPGLMPNSEWKKRVKGEEWQPGENLSTAIGQGYVSVTPLQMAVAYNTIGLEGKVYRPFIIKKIINRDGKVLKESQPTLVRDITQKQPNGYSISVETFKTVKEGLRRVANGDHGTARFLKIPGVQMAGKTGTSQVREFSADQIYGDCLSRPIQMRHHGWYIAFAPADKPEITVAALAEHSCHGNTGAGPVVKDIMEAYFKKYHPDWIEDAIKKAQKKPAVKTPQELEDE
jgi:penicillin-binding protein 2